MCLVLIYVVLIIFSLDVLQVRSMKRARDIRDQLEGLLERVEIEISTNLNDLDAIKKSITSGTVRNTEFCIFFLMWF